jgi:hypothetical protein
MKVGVAAYAIVRNTEAEAKRENYQQWLAGMKLEQQVSLEDYSVSNRGLRSRSNHGLYLRFVANAFSVRRMYLN